MSPTTRALLYAAGLLVLGLTITAIWGYKMRAAAKREVKAQENLVARMIASYDAVSDGILATELNGNILTANQKARELFRHRLEEGTSISCLITSLRLSDGEDDGVAAFLEKNRDSDTLCEEEVRLLGEEPTHLQICARPIALKEEEGNHGHLWTIRDVTKERQLEESLVQSQKMEAVGTLAGGIAHDFNNLLTGISGNLAILRIEPERTIGEASDELDAAAEAAHRGAELIKQLLGFSRRTALKLETCSVYYVLDSLQKLLRHAFDSSINLEFDPGAGDVYLRADPNQIEQVLLNLCVNARDAMPDGGTIRVDSREVTEYGKSFVEIAVWDNGSGMSKEVREKIFEPFFTTKDIGKGTGLGLAMSYGIIEQHGGSIKCESEEGAGTEFKIRLPLADASETKDIKAPTKLTTRIKLGSGGERVLVVDDEAIVRAVAEGVLRKGGYEVLSAGGGEEAIRILEKENGNIDLILLDMTMPGMGGKDVFEIVRERYPEVIIAICSGYIVERDQFGSAAEEQPEAIMQKPYEIEALTMELRRLLDERGVKTS